MLDEAHRALRSVVAPVKADGWQAPTPCEEWNAAQVLQHAAGDQLGYAAKRPSRPVPGGDVRRGAEHYCYPEKC